jgi:uncharacterized protein
MLAQVLEKLWELQQAMSELGAREKQLTTKPEPFAGTDREYTEASSTIEGLKAQREVLEKTRRETERNLEVEQETLQKYESQLMKVKNQMQYAAAWKEIDTARKKVREMEESLLSTMSEIERIDEDLAQRETTLAPIREKYEEQYREWQDSLAGIREEAERVREKISQIETLIPETLKKQFYRIFEHRQGVAVTTIENNACNACRFKVRPAVSQQVKRGEVIFCDQCRRIIYVERVVAS